jgi:hypothetical protein
MPEYLELVGGERVEARGPAAQAYLDLRAGAWRIVPSHPSLVLLRRDRVDAAEAGVRAVLAGDIQGLALGEILAYLAQSRWTGVLTVAAASVEKSIFLREGTIRWASSTAPEDRLGVVLGRLGLVEPEALETILRSQPNAGSKLGALLLSQKLLSSADLYAALKHQVQEIFFSLVVLREGLYFLFNDPVEARFPAQISLDLGGMLMEGLRRFDEMEHFRDRIPGPHVYVRTRDRSPEGLNEEERALFEAARGGASPSTSWPGRFTSRTSTPPRSSTASTRPATWTSRRSAPRSPWARPRYRSGPS